MHYTILAFAIGAIAAPFASTSYGVCPTGLYSNPQCCATDVLNVADLDCKVPATTPTSTDQFISGCAATGQQAKCCVIPVAGQALLCRDVSPGANKNNNGDADGGKDGDDGGKDGDDGGKDGDDGGKDGDDGGDNDGGAPGGGAQAAQTPTTYPASQETGCYSAGVH